MHNFDPVKKLNSLFDTLKDPDLTPTDKLVYAVLVFRYNSRTRQCNPSIETLANDVNLSSRTISRLLKELRDHKYITNFRGFPSKGSNMYQLKHSKVGLLKKKKNKTKLTSLHDSIDDMTSSLLSCKTMNETMKETMNNISDESELHGDSLSEIKEVNNNEDTKVESLDVRDSDKESITKERFYEVFPFLNKDK